MPLSSLVHAVADTLRAMLAIPVALLPARSWAAFDRLPVRRVVFPSAFATALFGFYLGARGYIAYVRPAADAAADGLLAGASRAISQGRLDLPFSPAAPQAYSMLSFVAFALFTPLGLLSTYLVLSGVARLVALAGGDPIGDPLLTAAASLSAGAWRRSRSAAARHARARKEGPELADRLMAGSAFGLAGVDLAVVASRRKPDWTAGTIVVTGGGWFRLGEPFDAREPAGLRTIYPLTRMEPTEVLRKAVRYDLPPLQRGPWPH